MRERALISKRSALILLLLRSQGALSSVQLSEYLGIPPRQVHGYIAYLKRKGLVESNSFTFSLTEKGYKYVDKYKKHLDYIIGDLKKLNLAKLGKTRLNLAKDIIKEIERLFDLDNCIDIVRFLVEFRLRTGRKYWWPGNGSHIDELSERLGISSYDIGSCLRKLESEGVIYMTLDKRRGVVKIRLGRQLDYLFNT